MKNYLLIHLGVYCISIGALLGQPPQKEFKDILLYIAKREPGFDIYRNNIQGNAEKKLTQNPGLDWRPQFVIESRQIIYNSQDTAGNFQMLKMSLNGDSRPMDMQGLPEFTISPNGKWAVYTKKDGDNTHIWMTPLKKPEDSLQITNQKGYQGRVVWSLKSDQFAFIADHSGSNEIYTYQLKTKKIKQITQNQNREKYISWSPDGKQLAFTMQREDTQNDIYLVNLGNAGIQQLTHTPDIHESEIAWSLSGKYIAYHAQVEGKDDIFVINLNDKKVSRVTQGNGYHGEPAWGLE